MGLKVANVIEEGRYGGPQSRIVSVAERLINYDIETTVIFPQEESQVFCEKLKEKGVKLHVVTLHHLTRDIGDLINYFLYFVPEATRLVKILKREKVDIVHCNGSSQIKGIIAGRLVGTRVIWHLNDTRRVKIINLFATSVGKYLCDGFIFASKRAQKACLLDGYSGKKPYFEIQAPVDTRIFDPDIVKLDQHMVQNGYLSIVTVGNVNRAKGLEYFIQMACLLNKKFHNLLFYIVGRLFPEQQKYSRRLMALIERSGIKNVFFRGWVKDVRPVLKSADVYVCSSVHEASPMSVWEAMAMAKPIVAADVGDVAEFIIDGEDGFIVPTQNSEALAEKVAILLADENLRHRFSEKVRRTAVEQLDVDRCVKKHAQAYRCIVGS
jgi:glycosyltransferase involved in cell wall biosynthesis